MFDDDSDIPFTPFKREYEDSTCVEKIKCKDCGHKAQQVWYSEVRGYTSHCYHCEEQKGDPYNGTKPSLEVVIKSKEEKAEEARELLDCPLFGDKLKNPYRCIPPKYFNSWGVRLLYSEYDGSTPYAVGFPYTDIAIVVGFKIRVLKKKSFFAIGNTKNVADMFGLERALEVGKETGYDILYITEGEFDAIALDYALVVGNELSDQDRYSVISLTNGGGTILDDLRKAWSRIKRFKRIVLVLDNDTVGLRAQEQAQKAYEKVLIGQMPLGCKDSNDAVKQDMIEELINKVQWEATRTLNEGEDLW